MSSWQRWLTQEPDAWPLKRLFWSARVPTPDEAHDPVRVAAVIGTILEEGSATDWCCIRWDAIRQAAVLIPPRYSSFWMTYWAEHDQVEARRHHVLDTLTRDVLRQVGPVVIAAGGAWVGSAALSAVYLGHRQATALVFRVPSVQVDDAGLALVAAWTGARIPWTIESSAQGIIQWRVGPAALLVTLMGDDQPGLEPVHQTDDGMPVAALPDLAADCVEQFLGPWPRPDTIWDCDQLVRYGCDWGTLERWVREKTGQWGMATIPF